MKNKGYMYLYPAVVIFIGVLFTSTSLVSQSVWQPSAGPYSGRIFSLAVDAQGNLFAGTERGGILTSDPSGSQWRYLALLRQSIACFFITSNGDMYAGTWKKLLRSTDRGTTWNSVGPPFDVSVFGLAINARGHIFAGGWDGVFRTTNGGQSWDTLRNGLEQQKVNTLASDMNGKLYVGTRAAVLSSTDNGDSWFLPDSSVFGIEIMDIEVVDGGEVFAGSSVGVLVSTDHGSSWRLKRSGMTDARIMTIMKSKEGSLYAGSQIQHIVYKSIDNGDTWSEVFRVPGNYPVRSMVENTSGIFIGTDGDAVYITTDKGGTWSKTSIGISNSFVDAMLVASNGNILAGGRAFNTAVSTDKGKSWKTTSDVQFRMFASAPNGVIYGAASQGVYHSADNGMSWVPDTAGISYSRLFSICIPDTNRIFAGSTSGKLYRSADNGASWDILDPGWGNAVIQGLAYDNSGYLFAGVFGLGFLRSSDNGDTWTAVAEDAGKWVYTIITDSRGDLYLGSSIGIWHSTDHGDSWSKIIYNLNPTAINRLLVTDNGTLVIGSVIIGVYYLDTVNKQWIEFNDGLYNKEIASLAYHPTGILFAGTNGSGIFQSRHIPMAIETTGSRVAGSLHLGYNYPNPVSVSRDGLTTIPFVTASGLASHARLVVYDRLGRVVRDVRITGKDAVELDVRGMSPGVYVYRLFAGRESKSKLFNVVK